MNILIKIEELKQKLTPKVIRLSVTGIFAAGFFGFYALDHGLISNPFEKDDFTVIQNSNDISETGIAKKDIHFVESKMRIEPETVTLYFSYTSKASLSVYKKLKESESKHPDINFRYIHINLSEDWSIAHKVKLTLNAMSVKNISDIELFNYFIATKTDKQLSSITNILLDKEVDLNTFNDTYNSIDISQQSAHDFESYVNTPLSFIPDIYVDGNKQVVLGSLKSYDDIKYVIDSIANKKHLTETQPNNTK